METFAADDGPEWLGVVKKWLVEEGIEIWTSAVYKRTNLVEGFNRILLSRLFKAMKDTGDYCWIKILPSVLAGYNMDKAVDKPFPVSGKFVDPFSIGDYVRVRLGTGVFVKAARTQKWSDDVYRILNRDRARYVIINRGYSVMPLNYLPKQLKLVPNGEELWKIEELNLTKSSKS